MSTENALFNPPWKKLVADILQKNLDDGHKESLNFNLATIKPGPKPRPAVRTVVFRGFVGETIEDSPPSKLPGGNPPARSSLFLVSTDALMAKVEELEQSSGAFEVGWWHAGTNQQIRFNGIAHLYRRNASIAFPEVRLKQYIQTSGDWTWEAERDRLWKSHRPVMRGSFRNPHPGTPMNAEKQKKLQVVELDEEDDGPDAREAKDRFTLVVLEVMEIEILDLDPPPVPPRCSPFDRLLTPCVRAKDVDGHWLKIARTLRTPHGMLRNYVPNSAPTSGERGQYFITKTLSSTSI
jgi:pyridoxamine 5'-phosphate oxidase